VRLPELPILNESGTLYMIAGDILAAIMVYPEDQEKQEEYLAAVLVEKCQDVGKDADSLITLAGITPWLLPALSRPRTAGGAIAAAKKATGSAWAAGEILLTMLAVSIHHPEINIRVSMTIDVLEEFQRGGPAGIGNRTLWDTWSRFRSVSHFYAVRRLWDLSVEDPEGMHWEEWITGDFDEYLAVAEDLRKMAVTRRFLSHEETWRVPDSLSLPPSQIEPGALLPELLTLFQEYRPKHSKR
jgi:hypothetical protein